MIMVDAEYTYLNPCLNLLTLAMMLHSNRSEPLVAYTYQNYLKVRIVILHIRIDFILLLSMTRHIFYLFFPPGNPKHSLEGHRACKDTWRYVWCKARAWGLHLQRESFSQGERIPRSRL